MEKLLPSEALNRGFVLGDKPAPEKIVMSTRSSAIHTHAVLVGDVGLLLPVGEVSELVDGLSVCRLPNTPLWFSGVTSVRGNIIAVFDLHELFSVVRKHKTARRMIVVGTNETAVAFWVDELPRMVTLRKQDSVGNPPPLPELLRQHIRDHYIKEHQIWVDWNVPRFFTSLGKQL